MSAAGSDQGGGGQLPPEEGPPEVELVRYFLSRSRKRVTYGPFDILEKPEEQRGHRENILRRFQQKFARIAKQHEWNEARVLALLGLLARTFVVFLRTRGTPAGAAPIQHALRRFAREGWHAVPYVTWYLGMRFFLDNIPNELFVEHARLLADHSSVIACSPE